jgi:HK97 gp10 family phage protein
VTSKVNHKSRNLGLLARRFGAYREKAVTALEFGADMLVAGMRIRAPRRTGRLVRAIRRTKVKNDHVKHRLTIRAYVASPYAIFQEFGTKHNRAQPFVRPTQAIDGPHAVKAMIHILKS